LLAKALRRFTSQSGDGRAIQVFLALDGSLRLAHRLFGGTMHPDQDTATG
jgi:hypothetical protein